MVVVPMFAVLRWRDVAALGGAIRCFDFAFII
jgi:hypothetical protein